MTTEAGPRAATIYPNAKLAAIGILKSWYDKKAAIDASIYYGTIINNMVVITDPFCSSVKPALTSKMQ